MPNKGRSAANGLTSQKARSKAPQPARVSRQQEAGEVTRRETRRKLLLGAQAEFAERGYAGATVSRIASRADLSLQTLYSAWGNKRNLLRAVLEAAVTGGDAPLVPGEPPPILLETLDPADADDPYLLLAHLSHQYRLLAERASVGWRTYREAAAVDSEVAADWDILNNMRRQGIRTMIEMLPSKALRRGLSKEAAVDTAWVIASPDSHDLLVEHAGYSYDDLEDWVRGTLSAALLA